MSNAPYISKSKYLWGLQCPKLLWTAFNQKDRIPGPDAATQAIFDQGHELALISMPPGKAAGPERRPHGDGDSVEPARGFPVLAASRDRRRTAWKSAVRQGKWAAFVAR